MSYAAVGLLVVALAGGLVYYQTGVAPLKAQEQARSALKDLGVEVQPFDDHRGRTVINLGRTGGRDAQSVLKDAAPHLAAIGGGDASKGLSLELASAVVSDLTPLAGLTDLRRLDVSATKVTDLAPLKGLPALEELDASGTGVNSLAPLAGLPMLRELNISGTPVADLSALASVGSLRRLDVSRTPVADVGPLARLTRLNYLNLAWTKVTNLAPLQGLTELRTLEIDGLGISVFNADRRIPRLRVFGAAEERKRTTPYKPGQVFRDCEQCPEMVVIPAGDFMMGSPQSEKGRGEDEGPQHKVTIARPLAVGKYEVTFDEWDACVAARGCKEKPGDGGWGRGRRPVILVSWEDAQHYVEWLSERTGKNYRLMSEAEWEYAARAGSTTRYPWGDELGSKRANCRDSGSQWSGKQTAPVGSFEPNAFGLYDMIGNVWEWVEDCYRNSYQGAPSDSRPWESASCGRRVVRGGSWNNGPEVCRSANRLRDGPGDRYSNLGFRLARTL